MHGIQYRLLETFLPNVRERSRIFFIKICVFELFNFRLLLDKFTSKHTKMSCCGSMFRFLLGLINVIFLVIGIALVVTTSVLKWANISQLKEISGLEKLLNLTSIDAVTITLLCIGAFIVFLSFVGLIGVCCSNRGFLVVYEIVTVLLFMAHVGALIALLVMQPKIEDQYRAMLNATVKAIVDPATSADEQTTKCGIMLGLSGLFGCFSLICFVFFVLFAVSPAKPRKKSMALGQSSRLDDSIFGLLCFNWPRILTS